MKVIKAIFSFFLILAFLVLVVGLGGRELVLLVGLNKLKSDLVQLKNLQSRGDYLNNCISMGASAADNEQTYRVQLRFIDNQNYVTEVVCNGISNAPITVGADKLPFILRKVAGSSGVIWPMDNSGVRLEILGRIGEISLLNEGINVKLKTTPVDLEAGPPAACGGYGFVCCNPAQEKGLGDQLVGVSDCPDDCYSSCAYAPVVLAFNTRPFYDQTTGQLMIKAGEIVNFSYNVSGSQQQGFAGQIEESDDALTRLMKNLQSLIDKTTKPNGEEKVQVILDFGDGQKENSFSLNNMVDHTYACASDQCQYTANVRALNMTTGARSADNLVSSIKIIVNR